LGALTLCRIWISRGTPLQPPLPPDDRLFLFLLTSGSSSPRCFPPPLRSPLFFCCSTGSLPPHSAPPRNASFFFCHRPSSALPKSHSPHRSPLPRHSFFLLAFEIPRALFSPWLLSFFTTPFPAFYFYVSLSPPLRGRRVLQQAA